MIFLGGIMRKSGLVSKPIFQAHTRHRLDHSRISAPIVWFGRLLVPAYLRIVLSFQKIEIRNPEKLVEAIKDFREKRTRLIVAFRHPYGDEPQLLFHIFENLIPRYARKLKIQLNHRTHLRLVHDYAVPLWGSALIRFLLPHVGAVPVYHVKSEPKSLQNIRSILRDGLCPIGIAPEGQISYHSEKLPRIETGTIRMGFWCASDIAKANRPEKVLVLPLSVHYQYDMRDMKKINMVLDSIEFLCGIESVPCTSAVTLLSLLPRIEAIEYRVLGIVEEYYAGTYGYQVQDVLPGESEATARQNRWNALQLIALEIAEHTLGLDPKDDDIVQRMYRIRLEGWNRVCPENYTDRLSPIETALAQRRAGEAWFAMRHMEFVDLMSYHDVEYIKGGQTSGPSFDRIVETVVSLEDLVNRLMGGNITNRSNAIRKKAIIMPANYLDLTERLTDYRKNPKQTVRDTTDELSRRFKDCIRSYKNETEC